MVFERLSTSPEGHQGLFNLSIRGITMKTWSAILGLLGLQRTDGLNRGWVMSRKDARMIFMWCHMLVVEETSTVEPDHRDVLSLTDFMEALVAVVSGGWGGGGEWWMGWRW